MTRVLALMTPEVVRSSADEAGEKADSVRKLLEGAIPALLAGLANRVGEGSFTAGLLKMLEKGSPAAGDLVPLALGDSWTTVSQTLAKWSGVRPATAQQGLATSAGLIVKALEAEHGRQPFTMSSLAHALESLRDPLRAFLPEPLAWLSGAGLPAVRHEGVSLVTRISQVLLVGAVMASVMFFYRGFPKREATPPEMIQFAPAAPKKVDVALPGGAQVSLLEGSFNFQLVRFLEDQNDRDLPRAFVFDHLNFFAGETRITPESVPTVDDLLAILKAYAAVDVRLEGHTDSQGDPAANQKLSLDRAAAIRALLVSRGIADRRVATAGYGSDKPVASNDTEEGRAQNRRLELVVVKK